MKKLQLKIWLYIQCLTVRTEYATCCLDPASLCILSLEDREAADSERKRERERLSAHHGVVCPGVVVEEGVVFILELWFQYKNCFTHPPTFPACGDQWTHVYLWYQHW